MTTSEFPLFEGSTGGWLKSANEEEKYVIIWKSSEKHFFELPTGGTAIMNLGKNLIYFARKEQCLALGTLLKTFKITNYKIFRITPPDDISLLHPFDGVFPEKVKENRRPAGLKENSIVENIYPALVKFSSLKTYEL